LCDIGRKGRGGGGGGGAVREGGGKGGGGETNIFTIVTASIPLFMWVLSYNWVRTWLFHR